MKRAAEIEADFDTLVRLIVHGEEAGAPSSAVIAARAWREPTDVDYRRILSERRESASDWFFRLVLKAQVDEDEDEQLDRIIEDYLHEGRQRFLDSLDVRYRPLEDSDPLSVRDWAEIHNRRDGFNLPSNSLGFAKLMSVIKDALLQADRDIMHHIQTGEALPPEATGSLARLLDKRAAANFETSPLMSEAVSRYKTKGGKRGAFPTKTLAAIDRALSLFNQEVGDKRLHEITSDDVLNFVRGRCSHIVGGKDQGSIRRPINRQTVQRDLSFLRSACSIEISHGRFKGINPIGQINLDHFITPTDPRTMPKKRPMETGELQALLRHPWFAGCASAVHVYRPGDYRLEDVRFWGPVVALFTGGRASELGGLLLEDVRLNDPFPHIAIRPNQYRGTKNGHERLVPVLDQLLRLGFDRYIERVRAARKSDRLFPDWELPQKLVNGAASTDALWANARWCVAFNRTVIPQALTGFLVAGARRAVTLHQTRGTFLTMLTAAKVPDRYIDQIIGHSAEGTRKHYQGTIPLSETYPAVRNASYVSIDFTALYRKSQAVAVTV